MNIEVQEFRLKLYPQDFYAVRSFYEKDLGLKVTNGWDRGDLDKGVMFQVGATTLELLSPAQGYEPVKGVGVSWEITNVHELWELWKNKSSVVFDLRDNPWGDVSFCISDPESLEITFFTKTT